MDLTARRLLRPIVPFLAAALLAPLARADEPAPTVLISMDAFRWDYLQLHPGETPHLRAIQEEGISAHSLIPVYPSNTFPNHYSIATGLYPAHHGMLNNTMFDPNFGEYFYYNRPGYSGDGRWWGGEPIWITAVREGKASACSLWPGSEAMVGGLRPTYWKPYNYSIPFADRLNELVSWLKKPAKDRPCVTAFYLEETNTAGHHYGPDSPETIAAIKLLDARVGEIRSRLQAEHLTINLVVVSDHGMYHLLDESILCLDDYIPLNSVQVDFAGPICGLRPLHESPESLVAKLQSLKHAKAYLTKDLPASFHLSGNPRIPPVWIMVDMGYEMYSHSWITSVKPYVTVADHGYDPAYPQMHGILMAVGPAFRTGGSQIADVPNVDVYNLICAVEHLSPAANDGDDTLVKAFLR